MEEWEHRFGRPLNEGYGLSETSPVTHSTPQLAYRKMGTIGLPFPDTDVKIVDVETGTKELPIGEAGGDCIHRPPGFHGHLDPTQVKPPAPRTHQRRRVWVHTPDTAGVDAERHTAKLQ